MDLRIPSYLQLVLNRVMAEHLSQTIKDFTKVGINVQTCRVLISLHHHRRLRPGTLAYLVGLEQTAVSHLLKRMTQRGFIARERDKRDNRAVDVCLTAKGRRLAIYCHEAALRQEQLLLRNLSAAEIDTLRKIVWKMDKNIRGIQLKKLSRETTNGRTDVTRVLPGRDQTARAPNNYVRPGKG
jgi:DNA-binding MarR family transcriptional regulator